MPYRFWGLLDSCLAAVDITAIAVQLEHPEQLYQQPVVGELKDNDWSVLMANFNNEIEAQQMATMLNH